jgi:hypothetical protein
VIFYGEICEFFGFFFFFSFHGERGWVLGFFLERGVDWFCGREMRGHS